MIKKIASIVRWLLLNISMILFLFVSVTRIGSASETGALIYGIMLLAAAGYLGFSLICLIISFIKRKVAGERDSMMDSLLDTVATMRNSRSIDLFRRLALWECFILLAALFLLHVPFESIYGGPYETELILKTWHGLLFWGLVSLPLMLIVTFFYKAFYMPHFGEGAYTFSQLAVKTLSTDMTAPIDIVKRLFDRERSDKFSVILDFVIMVLFVLINAAGIIMTVL